MASNYSKLSILKIIVPIFKVNSIFPELHSSETVPEIADIIDPLEKTLTQIIHQFPILVFILLYKL